jgi:hypothetical protein
LLECGILGFGLCGWEFSIFQQERPWRNVLQTIVRPDIVIFPDVKAIKGPPFDCAQGPEKVAAANRGGLSGVEPYKTGYFPAFTSETQVAHPSSLR